MYFVSNASSFPFLADLELSVGLRLVVVLVFVLELELEAELGSEGNLLSVPKFSQLECC